MTIKTLNQRQDCSSAIRYFWNFYAKYLGKTHVKLILELSTEFVSSFEFECASLQ